MNSPILRKSGAIESHPAARWMTLLAGVLVALAMLLANAVQGEAAAALKGSFRGNAYATYANATAGPVASTLGRSAFQPCPCSGTHGKTLTNTVDSVSTAGGRVLKADVTRSTVHTKKTSTSAVVRNTATVSGLRALDGLIKADTVKSVASTSANARTVRSSLKGSTFVNLRVAGRPIRADVSPNTKVPLSGIGYVLLKHPQRSGNGKSSSGIAVDMLTIVVTQNNTLGLPIGSRIVVAHAASGFFRTQPKAELGGQAYAASAKASSTLLENQVGRAAFVVVGCEGTNGKVRHNNINSLSAGNILSSGAGTTTAYGKPLNTGGVARTTATVHNVNLLGDLITADTIKAVAQDTYRQGHRSSSTKGSGFVNLRVSGKPVSANTSPNTRIKLPGIGYVVVNEQTIPKPSSTSRTQVNGLHVYVTTANTLGLPVGTQLIVAHADSKAFRF